MDQIVEQAMAKWPNVPFCYGWLGLDARGNWRMRDERTQHHNLAGDKIAHVALLGFIARNYTHDAAGCWYFQNGPQRVYVNLEATPYIARSEPDGGLVLHTGAALASIEAAWLCTSGELIVQSGAVVAQLDDRDTAQILAGLHIDGQQASDEAVVAWLEGGAGRLALPYRGRLLALQRLDYTQLAQHFGFQQAPTPELASKD